MNMKSMSMYSTQYLVGASFAWITAAMRRGMESISLWHCPGVMRAQVALIVAFSSSTLLGLAYRIFLFTFTPVKVRRVCWPIKNRDTMVLKPGTGSFGTVCRCQVLLENEICISIKLVSSRKHEVCSKTSWYTAVLTLDLKKHSGPTPADDMARQTITDFGNFTLDLKQRG